MRKMRTSAVATLLVCLVFASTGASQSLLVVPPTGWSAPAPLSLGHDALYLQSGALKLGHETGILRSVRTPGRGKRMAIGQSRPLVGYLQGDSVRWFTVHEASGKKVEIREEGREAYGVASFDDPDGGHWKIDQRFTSIRHSGRHQRGNQGAGGSGADNHLSADAHVVSRGGLRSGPARGRVFLPAWSIWRMNPAARRRISSGRRPIAGFLILSRSRFPLMAIQAGELYVALTWEPQPDFSALFDSPDRIFHSGGHVMGILFPGSNGRNRTDGELLPREGTKLAANTPLVLRATFLGGRDAASYRRCSNMSNCAACLPCPRRCRCRNMFPWRPADGSIPEFVRGTCFVTRSGEDSNPSRRRMPPATCAGWRSGRRTHRSPRGSRSPHGIRLSAVKPDRVSFGFRRACDHADGASGLRQRPGERARRPCRWPAGLLERFEPDGRVLYRKKPDGIDFGKTHFAPEANGLTAQVVVRLLDAAVFSGDRVLIDEALRRLRGLDKFRDDVPRGAQTWEVPLHTPDLLAAAHLMRAYLTGFELTGEEEMLAQARYWAWTGVPFIYLVPPTSHPIGLYGTVAVYGATKWKAPIWFGLPVQWCGLVYADGLYRLARLDPGGPWRQLADGITASGLQQIWPRTDPKRQGLSPDVFYLASRSAAVRRSIRVPSRRMPRAIYRQTPFYDFRAVRERGWLIHLPGEIAELARHINRCSLCRRRLAGRVATSFSFKARRNFPKS